MGFERLGQLAYQTTPARQAFAVTPSDTADLPREARALWVGGAGNVKLMTLDGDTVTFQGIAAGTMLPVMTRRVFSTDTTATLIVGVL